MNTMFFASNMFEIYQTQNIVSQLQLDKQKTYLVLWLKNPQDFTFHLQYADKNLFSDIIFMHRPIWKTHPIEGRQILLRAQRSLEELIKALAIEEIFVPDPEKEYQLLESISDKNNIKLSLYESGLNTYRYLYSHDPNHRNLSYRLSALKKAVLLLKKKDKKRNIFILMILLFFDSFPEFGQLFFSRSIKGMLFRLKSFHRCLCTNPEAIAKIYDVKKIEPLLLKNLVSNKQQMSVYSNHDFWDIKPDYLLFIDQNYLDFGVSPRQHVELVIQCLETFGRVSGIVIKTFWNASNDVVERYQKIIARKKYKIQIIQTEVIAEVIVGTKKIRKIASLSGMSYIYTKMSSPEIRNYCFHRTYEEKAKEMGISPEVLKRIRKFHDFFDQINPLFNENDFTPDNKGLSNSFYNFSEPN
ncbi:MAG: polysialyltransferase family glycosyltransferase [Brevinema sp.]